jgi:hypothetical protein
MALHAKIYLITNSFGRRGIIIDIEFQSACPFVGNMSPPPPLPASVSSPLDPKAGGSNTPLRVREVGVPNSDDWKESLTFCILCGFGGSRYMLI